MEAINNRSYHNEQEPPYGGSCFMPYYLILFNNLSVWSLYFCCFNFAFSSINFRIRASFSLIASSYRFILRLYSILSRHRSLTFLSAYRSHNVLDVSVRYSFLLAIILISSQVVALKSFAHSSTCQKQSSFVARSI